MWRRRVGLGVKGRGYWIANAVHEDYRSSCANFHVEADLGCLESIYNHLRACTDTPGCALLSFQPYCFGARRSSDDTDEPVNDTTSTSAETTRDQAKMLLKTHTNAEAQTSPPQTSPRSKHHVHELLQRSVDAARGVKSLATNSNNSEQTHHKSEVK